MSEKHSYKVISVDVHNATWVLEIDGRLRRNFPIPVNADGSVPTGIALDAAVVEIAEQTFMELEKVAATNFSVVAAMIGETRDVTDLVADQRDGRDANFTEPRLVDLEG